MDKIKQNKKPSIYQNRRRLCPGALSTGSGWRYTESIIGKRLLHREIFI